MKRLMQYPWPAVLALAVLVSCAQLGLEVPTSPEEKIAVGFNIATAVNQAAVTLIRDKKLTAADGEQVRDATRAAVDGLRIARSMLAIDPKSADAKADMSRASLEALRRYLILKGGKV